MMQRLAPGIACAAAAAATAFAATAALGMAGVCLSPVMSAILVGLALNAIGRPGSRFEPGLEFCEKRVLEFTIVCLGAELDVRILAGLGPAHMAAILAAMAAVIAASPFLARALGLSRSLGLLLGIGTAVCGSAAIVAVSPAIARDRQETALAIGVVNLAGFIGMLVIPIFVKTAGLGAVETAVLLGGALPAVAHAVAAGYAFGDAVGALTVTVKMGRVLCLLPIVVLLNLAVARRRGARDAAVWRQLPWFVPGFVLLAALRSSGLLPYAPEIVSLGKACLVLALAAVAMRIDLKALAARSTRALAAGAICVGAYTAFVAFATR